jgi:hypothetical protein
MQHHPANRRLIKSDNLYTYGVYRLFRRVANAVLQDVKMERILNGQVITFLNFRLSNYLLPFMPPGAAQHMQDQMPGHSASHRRVDFQIVTFFRD